VTTRAAPLASREKAIATAQRRPLNGPDTIGYPRAAAAVRRIPGSENEAPPQARGATSATRIGRNAQVPMIR
jgi:hypothetical protein